MPFHIWLWLASHGRNRPQASRLSRGCENDTPGRGPRDRHRVLMNVSNLGGDECIQIPDIDLVRFGVFLARSERDAFAVGRPYGVELAALLERKRNESERGSQNGS